jgi:hypothetical protein
MTFLGLAAVLICLSILLLGAQETAWTAERIFATLTVSSGPLSQPWPPTMDSELRFYAPFWGAYGILLLMSARDWPRRSHWVPWLAVVFFAGGVGRAISFLTVGPPHPLFTLLMAIELLTPPVLAALWLVTRRRGQDSKRSDLKPSQDA